MRSAIIAGVSGQDGSYLAEILLEANYRVIGAVRDVHKAKKNLPVKLADRIEFVEWSLLDQQEIMDDLQQYRPNELYNFAAYSSGAGMFDDPVGIGEVNGLAVTRILESIHQVDHNIRFCQASSSEMFGNTDEFPQTELTTFCPRTPYGSAKLYAHGMIDIFRQRYGIFACSAILYNHESPRRGHNFVTQKVVRAAASIKLGITRELTLGTLDARRDWGFAKDYVNAMRLMLGRDRPDDYVIATGVTHSIRDLCEFAFRHLDLDYRDFVSVKSDNSRVLESIQLVGDASKAKKELGWEAEIKFSELIQMMVDYELERLECKN